MTRDRALWSAAMTNELLVLGIIWVMTLKPDWAGGIATLVIAYAVGLVFAARMTRESAVEDASAAESTG
jgi:hypothetical protein